MAKPAERSRRREKSSQLKVKAAAAAGLLALALLILGAWRAASRSAPVYEPDPNAAPVAEGRVQNAGELRQELQSQADASNFRMQLNARPTVRGNQAELLLGNPAGNQMNLSISISLDEDGEILYESGPLVPGAQVLTAELNKALPPGEYQATAICTAIDPATGEAVGNPVQAGLLLTAVEPDTAGTAP